MRSWCVYRLPDNNRTCIEGGRQKHQWPEHSLYGNVHRKEAVGQGIFKYGICNHTTTLGIMNIPSTSAYNPQIPSVLVMQAR